MKEYFVEQRSREWFDLRSKLPTASEFSKIITANGSISSQFEQYADNIKKGITNNFTSKHLERGVMFEDVALSKLELEEMINIEKAGFIVNNGAGASPDGVLRDFVGSIYAGVEVKCPTTEIHEKYKKENKVPSIYYSQVMGSIAVCEVDYWYFASYDAVNDDLFYLKVERNEEWISKFWGLIKVFGERLK